MTDMLVKLYALPPLAPLAAALARDAVVMRRPLACEKHLVTTWFGSLFGVGWASECETAFSRLPVACFIAAQEARIAGVACYDCTCRNFFGPIGVAPTWRGRQIGRGLLLACLHAMAAEGYAYAIIGGVGPLAFFSRSAGAVAIEGSTPGIYPDSATPPLTEKPA
ncbi:MAG: GNAT family N-acetyltransferase [Desulfobacterales bacterium]|nr:GNAT family N-acetyltransferase [Desulfobacterales bacterium]